MKDKVVNTTIGVVTRIFCIVMTVIFTILFIMNLIGTTTVDITKNNFAEYALYTIGNPVVSIIVFVLLLGLIYVLFNLKTVEKIDETLLKRVIFVVVIVIGIVWVLLTRGRPVEDQVIVSKTASDFINNNFSSFNVGEYLSRLPQQIGPTFLLEHIYRVFGQNNYQAVMFINVVCCGGVFLNLYAVIKSVYDNKKILNWFSIIFALFFAFPMYSNFVYGTIIGLFFATLGTRLFVKVLQLKENISKKKILLYIAALLSFAFSIICKANDEIIVIAVIICAIIYAVKRKQYINIIFAVLLVVSFFGISLVHVHYKNVSQKDINTSSPATMWIAMGLQEGSLETGCGANGWYNGYAGSISGIAAKNYDEANKIAKKDMNKRLGELAKDPWGAVKFFGGKVSSQWAEPTYQVFWMLTCRNSHDELSPIGKSALEGKICTLLTIIMRYVLLIILLGNVFFFWRNRKEGNYLVFILGMSMLGGFLFHLVWEAKALYSMPYILLSIPCGAIGLTYMVDSVKKRVDKKLNKKNA